MAKPTQKADIEAIARGGEEAARPDDPLFPPHLERMEGVAELRARATDPEEYGRIIETICGTADDSQPVELYDGTLGVPVAFVNAHQSPVGQLQWNDNLASIYTNPGNVSGVRWCTGTLISNDLFLTAGHCFDQTGGGWQRPRINGTTNIIPPSEIATNMHVNFNYQVDPSGNLRTEQSFPVLQLTEYRLGGLDFAIARLGGNPGTIFGTTQISTTDAAVGDMTCIIGHPAGQPKRIEAGPVTELSGNLIRYNDIDTLGGNSGSGILRAADGRIVGVHTNGGCNPDMTGSNFGVRITRLIEQSPTLQTLTRPKLKFIDDGGTAKFADDGGGVTIKFIDDGGGKLKFLDDGGTAKFADDGGGVTIKFFDDGGTQKNFDDIATRKNFDDVKNPALDTSPIADQVISPDPFAGAGPPGGARPFVLATPHHSTAFAGPAAMPQQAAGREAARAQYEQQLAQFAQLLQQGMAALAALDQQYQQLLAEYRASFGQP